ncbi:MULTISPECIES: saccharopine dehydrogenase family protein [unclassified Mycobacterium]|uniref:saccharopine dehydrogenase family protein n=1 Tax=unclassified Mycobacterium TaxID=2642494 RepID=UPI0029C6E9DC|nr:MULTISPECIES: saccharopine dehydrogenase NADP-binding domain-containing protein [unclassified Mycobacterium]
MRILALGAAGEMGKVAAGILAADESVTTVVIADRDGPAAAAAAQSLGAKAVALELDVTDSRGLGAAMADCDVVVNTVGPYFRFGVPLLRAAIDARRHYVDICDDPEPTLDMLALDQQAKASGVTALIGMGASPGLSNLLAVIAGRELERVDEVHTGWSINGVNTDSTDTVGAAVVHGMQQISGTIPVTRNGIVTTRPALEKIVLQYPGIGIATGRSFGHPEAVTLQRVFGDLVDNTNVVVGDRITLALLSVLRFAIDHRLVGLDAAARIANTAERMTPADPTRMIRPGQLPPLFAVASGIHAGRPATVAVALGQFPGFSMAAITGVPLAIAALQLADLDKPGVHTPETALEPEPFFGALAQHCIGRPHPTAMTIITRSWQSAAENRAALNGSLVTAFLNT